MPPSSPSKWDVSDNDKGTIWPPVLLNEQTNSGKTKMGGYKDKAQAQTMGIIIWAPGKFCSFCFIQLIDFTSCYNNMMSPTNAPHLTLSHHHPSMPSVKPVVMNTETQK